MEVDSGAAEENDLKAGPAAFRYPISYALIKKILFRDFLLTLLQYCLNGTEWGSGAIVIRGRWHVKALSLTKVPDN